VTEIPVQFRLGIPGCKPQDLAGTGGPPDEETMHSDVLPMRAVTSSLSFKAYRKDDDGVLMDDEGPD